MKFCSNCASPVSQSVPPGDNRPRYCCDECDTIHYQNPNMVLGTVPVFEDRILLCRRAIEPRHGYWTLPAGFMEHHETVAEGAARETREEAGIEFELGDVFSILSVPHVGQVHLFYLADMTSPVIDPGPETLEAALFDEKDIPWDEIAFQTVERTLRWYLEDRRSQQWILHSGDIHFKRRR